MKIIQEGSHFTIHSDDIQTHNQLPAGFYNVNFNPKSGYSLLKTEPLIMAEKAFGKQQEKIAKVLNHFSVTNRNLGIILSGQKGIGKSFFTKNLAIKAVEENYPVIIIQENTPALTWFLESIQQEVIVLMDEFDKKFPKDTGVGQTSQEDMLSMLDGINTGKKLFVVTCNELSKMSEYVINRPGRFHYHFRFSNPTSKEIENYLRSKLLEKYYSEISKVLDFSSKVDLNYDCLRAIAQEINLGYGFEEAISDLNILTIEPQTYDVKLVFTDGTYLTREHVRIDLFSESTIRTRMNEIETEDCYSLCYVYANTKSGKFDYNQQVTVIPKESITVIWDKPYVEEPGDEELSCNTLLEKYKNKSIKEMTIQVNKSQRNYHYYLY